MSSVSQLWAYFLMHVSVFTVDRITDGCGEVQMLFSYCDSQHCTGRQKQWVNIWSFSGKRNKCVLVILVCSAWLILYSVRYHAFVWTVCFRPLMRHVLSVYTINMENKHSDMVVWHDCFRLYLLCVFLKSAIVPL